MAEKRDKDAGAGSRGLRMNQLSAATGLPRSTILFYLAQGLLPPPVKTSRNMAYYPPECVERLNLIKTLQGRYRLPLEKIRGALEMSDQGQEIGPLLDLLQAIFGQASGPFLDRAQLAEASGLDLAQIQDLERARLLMPLQEQAYDQEDLAMARVYAAGLALGLSAQDMAFYPQLGDQIIQREMELRQRLTETMPLQQNAQVSLGMLQAARSTRAYVLDRLFQLEIVRRRNLRDPGGPGQEGQGED